MPPPTRRPSLPERALDRIPFLEKELLLLRRLVAPGDVCLDVGAAGGAHLLVMARRAGPHGHVLGFEPRPAACRALERVVRWAGYQDRVRLSAVALADEVGTQQLRVPLVPTRAHFRGSVEATDDVAALAALPHREIRVPTTTVDAVVEAEGLRRVNVLKCDVEGAELLVLAGARRVLDHHRPVVIVEAEDQHQAREGACAQDVVDSVRAHDYRAYRYRRGALEAIVDATADENDYVFVPAERTPPVPVVAATRHGSAGAALQPAAADGAPSRRE